METPKNKMKTQPTPKKAVMIDIETLGTTTGSIIYQIGAVEFCPNTFQTGRETELHICPIDSHTHGLTTDHATITWHEEKKHPLPLTQGQGAHPLPAALKKLTHFITALAADQIWCRGTSFDFPLIEAAYHATHTTPEIPWKYHQQYDLRTIWNLAFPDEKPPTVAHTALADCHTQIDQLAAANNRIIDLCIEGITDGQLIGIARKRTTPELIYGTPFPQMQRHPSGHTFYCSQPRNAGKTATAKAAMEAFTPKEIPIQDWADAFGKPSDKTDDGEAPLDFEDLYRACLSDNERSVLFRLAKKHHINHQQFAKAAECRDKEKELKTKIREQQKVDKENIKQLNDIFPTNIITTTDIQGRNTYYSTRVWHANGTSTLISEGTFPTPLFP